VSYFLQHAWPLCGLRVDQVVIDLSESQGILRHSLFGCPNLISHIRQVEVYNLVYFEKYSHRHSPTASCLAIRGRANPLEKPQAALTKYDLGLIAVNDTGNRCPKRITSDEWVDFLIRSIGMEPSQFDRRLKVPMGIASVLDMTDFHLEAIDLLGNHVPCEAGIALIVAIYSAIKKTPALPGLVILGDLSIQGNIKAVQSLVEPLQMAMENGAKRALVPLENKRNFLEVSGDIIEKVDPIFYSDPQTAAAKALGLK
jgi:hypothetical protein